MKKGKLSASDYRGYKAYSVATEDMKTKAVKAYRISSIRFIDSQNGEISPWFFQNIYPIGEIGHTELPDVDMHFNVVVAEHLPDELKDNMCYLIRSGGSGVNGIYVLYISMNKVIFGEDEAILVRDHNGYIIDISRRCATNFGFYVEKDHLNPSQNIKKCGYDVMDAIESLYCNAHRTFTENKSNGLLSDEEIEFIRESANDILYKLAELECGKKIIESLYS